MNEVIDSFSHIIESYGVVLDREKPKVTELKIRITFTDQSILEYTEINVIPLSKRK